MGVSVGGVFVEACSDHHFPDYGCTGFALLASGCNRVDCGCLSRGCICVRTKSGLAPGLWRSSVIPGRVVVHRHLPA